MDPRRHGRALAGSGGCSSCQRRSTPGGRRQPAYLCTSAQATFAPRRSRDAARSEPCSTRMSGFDPRSVRNTASSSSAEAIGPASTPQRARHVRGDAAGPPRRRPPPSSGAPRCWRRCPTPIPWIFPHPPQRLSHDPGLPALPGRPDGDVTPAVRRSSGPDQSAQHAVDQRRPPVASSCSATRASSISPYRESTRPPRHVWSTRRLPRAGRGSPAIPCSRARSTLSSRSSAAGCGTGERRARFSSIVPAVSSSATSVPQNPG